MHDTPPPKKKQTTTNKQTNIIYSLSYYVYLHSKDARLFA